MQTSSQEPKFLYTCFTNCTFCTTVGHYFFYRYALLVKDKQAIIDIPPKYVKLKAYRTTLGHKGKFKWSSISLLVCHVSIVAANHSFRQHNAEFLPFHFHPVLGSIMAVMAVKDILKGSEVRDGCMIIIWDSKVLFFNIQII